MNTITPFFVVWLILFAHWICDFVLQTDKQAVGKSRHWDCLLEHTGTYSLSIFFFMLMLIPFNLITISGDFVFILITFVCHTITDYFTSRLNSRLWREEKRHLFFVSIGFDQLLHFTQLIFTYYLIRNI